MREVKGVFTSSGFVFTHNVPSSVFVIKWYFSRIVGCVSAISDA